MKKFQMAAILLCAPMVALGEDANGLDSLIAPGAKLEKLSGGFKFTEGPTCDKDGNVFFTDQPNNRIMKWSVDGKLSTFLEPSGRSNGMMFDRDGNLISCADEDNELWNIAPDGTHTVIAKGFEGNRLGGPNDIWIAPNGGYYLSDPLYKRSWWKHTDGWGTVRGVYLLAPGTKELKLVAADLTQPNGITGTPDGKLLYVSDINAKKCYRFDIQADGSLAGKTRFYEINSDGMTIDEKGNIYFSNQDGVTVVDPSGKKLGSIPTGEKWTANVSFGGADHKTLFVTASENLYAFQMNVRGGNPAK